MAAIPYSFGSFVLNDGINYFLLSKDSHSIVPIAETLFKIGRLEGMKKTGQVTNERTVTAQVRVLGTSRVDLENKIDALLAALSLPQQQLSLHANDGRYFIADCTQAQIPLGPGNVVTTVVALTFLCQFPYAFADSASNFLTSSTTLVPLGGNVYQFSAPFTFSGGGNVYSRPTIILTANNAQTWTQLQIQQLTDGQYLTVVGNLPTANNDTITIVGDPYATNGAKVYKNNNVALLCTPNGAFPVLEPTPTQWQIQVSAGATAPQVTAQFTWTPRWLG